MRVYLSNSFNNGKGYFAFSSTNVCAVQEAMLSRDVMPDFTDSLVKPVVTKDKHMIQMIKRIKGFVNDPLLIIDPRAKNRGTSVKSIRESMIIKMGDTCPFNAGSLTRTALLAQLFQHRYESGSYLFYKELYEVIVDAAHPFRVEIEPARRGYSKATVSLYYKVQ